MEPHPLERLALEAVERHGMIPSHAGLLAAVSGGPDSTAMLLILNALAGRLDFRLHAAHINYALRGPDSDADEQLVRELCDRLRVPLHLLREPDLEAPALSGSFQMRARRVRIDFLDRVRREQGLDRIAVAHNRDDRIETLLIRILRGASPDSLAAILPVSGPVIRPLINASRELIVSYLAHRGQEFRTDATNLTGKYLRNRVRNQLLPLLRLEYNPGIDDALLRLAELAHRDRLFFDELIGADPGLDLIETTAWGDLKVPVRPLADQPAAVLGRVALRLLDNLPGDRGRTWESTHVHALVRLIRDAEPGETLSLPNRVWAHRESSALILGVEEPGLPDEPLPLPVPGRFQARTGGPIIEAGTLEAEPEDLERLPRDRIVIRADRAGPLPLLVRRRRDGDRLRPLGLDAEVKLKKLFADNRVPRWRRDSIPVVTTRSGEIIWVAGLRMDHRFRVEPGATPLIELRLHFNQPGGMDNED